MKHIIGIPYKNDPGLAPVSNLINSIKRRKHQYRITNDWISILGYAAIEPKSMIWIDWKMIKKDYSQFHKKLTNLETANPLVIFSIEDGIPNSIIQDHANIFYLLRNNEPESKIDDLIIRLEKYSNLKENLSDEGKKVLQPRGFGQFSGNSDNMLDLYQRIDKVAPSTFSIMINGQSGSGKELVAQTIHDLSKRKNNKYITINCAAIPENLLESELFGYVKGAFTDAKENKAGKFEQADKGTIFLDEIGDMPMQLQVKLLRVLNDNVVQRIGDNSEGKKVDVRFISATHQDLNELIKDNLFRHDLYHRINVIPLSIDPLMDRDDDLQLLIVDLLADIANDAGTEVKKIDWSYFDRLSQVELKGNIRELKNILTRSMFEMENDTLEGDLLEDILGNTKILPAEIEKSDTVQPLWEVEKEAIERALNYYDYNISEVSRKLDISRASLYRKMEKYELGREE